MNDAQGHHPHADGRIAQREQLKERLYPEVAAGGYTRVDGTVEFYTRVNALLRPDMIAVDFGAGRSRWFHDDPTETRRQLRLLQGKVAKVIGIDVDPVVQTNPTLDEAHVIEPGERLPLDDESVDLILSDYTFEHVDDPGPLSREFTRVLKPGGWICARTPNRWGYIALGASRIPNSMHARLLGRLQPGRKDRDVFPTRYRMNTRRQLQEIFPPEVYRHVVYTHNPEPLYFGNNPALWRVVQAVSRVAPQRMGAMLMIFLQKK